MCHGSGTGGKINLPRETDRHRATAFSFVSMILDGIIAYRCFLVEQKGYSAFFVQCPLFWLFTKDILLTYK